VPRPKPARALSEAEQKQILDVLHQERFMDKAPAEVYARLLDEGHYVCSISTMYRILGAAKEIRERRNQARHPVYSMIHLRFAVRLRTTHDKITVNPDISIYGIEPTTGTRNGGATVNAQTLWVPFSVLNGTEQSANTRLIWLLLCREPPVPDSRLRKLSGLDCRTIATIRSALARAPLVSCCARPHQSCAAIPWPLLTNPNLSAGARLLYGQLQGVPNFAHPGGSFTCAALSHLTKSSDDALRRAVAELVTTGWLTITQTNRKSPLCFELRNPVSAQLRARISRVRRRVKRAQHRGEALLREFLTLLVNLDDYEENASPDHLLNPYSGELLELDRYYPTAGVAVEFNGAQHYEETDLATFEETAKQVGRDAMKAFICKARGIELAIIHPEDLTLKAIDQKLPGRLPRRDLEALQPLVAALEELASDYRERTAGERARKGPRPYGGHGRPGA
jgi:hypothetical protein